MDKPTKEDYINFVKAEHVLISQKKSNLSANERRKVEIYYNALVNNGTIKE